MADVYLETKQFNHRTALIYISADITEVKTNKMLFNSRDCFDI